MQLTDFDFKLPEELIAQYPKHPRSASRLLCLARHTGDIEHRFIRDLPQLLRPGDLLVFNDTKVIPARLFGYKATGGKVEILLERLLTNHTALTHIKASKAPQTGQIIYLSNDTSFKVLGREGDLFLLESLGTKPLLDVLTEIGHVPLPPYIRRPDKTEDITNYQTIFARHPGSVAAPTAGLHFDEGLLRNLTQRGIQHTFVTLHVGAGTFQPVRSKNILEHQMHGERYSVNQSTCDAIEATRAQGGRVIAVGTTSVRTLEMLGRQAKLTACSGETDLFIYPGFDFRVIDGMISNFHLPQSTLLMLISAFAGREAILHAYQEAVEQKYRFYSYGDAMLIAPL